MIKVECPSCTAPYDLDERRLPQNGLKMRCPKCGASFRVFPTGETGPADAPQKPGGAAPAPAKQPKRTMVGVAPPATKPGAPRHVPGTGPAKPPAPKPPAPAAPKPPAPGAGPKQGYKPAAPPGAGDGDADLPALKRPGGGKPPLAPPFPGGGDDADLPALKKPGGGKAPLAPPFPGGGDHADLPALKKPAHPEESFADLGLASEPPPGGGGIDIDLPAPKPAAPKPPSPAAPPKDEAAFDDLDLDLPGPKKTPAPAWGQSTIGEDEPTVMGERPPELDALMRGEEVDLPARKVDADLPARKVDADLPVPKVDADLPRPKPARGGGSDFDDLDLPMPKSDMDLPTPARGSDDFGDLDLPVPKAGQDLPVPAGGGSGSGFDDLDLPVPSAGRDLPAPASGGGDFGDLDLPVPKAGQDLPVPKRGAEIDDLDLPPPDPSDDLSFDLPEAQPHPPPRSGGVDLDSDLDLPPPRDGHVTADGRPGAGGVGFGEIDLGGDEGGDDMEFADIPQERDSMPGGGGAAAAGDLGVVEGARPGASGAVVGRIERPSEAPVTPRRKRRKGRGLLVVGVLLLLLVGAGVAAGSFTTYGYFGVYALEQYLPDAGDDATAQRVIQEAEQTAASDTWVDVRRSLRTLGDARATAGLNRRLLARSLVHESLFQVRFGGEQTGSEGRATAIAHRLEQRGWDAPGASLAQAAHALADQGPAAARPHLSRARSEAPNDPYVHLVAGEAALADGDREKALEEFRAAEQKGAGARGTWGVARALRGSDQPEALAAAIDRTLEQSPRHAEALVAKGHQAFAAGDLDEAARLARLAAGAELLDGERVRTSDLARSEAFALLGRVYERRGNRTQARSAYESALEHDPYQVAALIGAGRVLLQDARYRDALARFESVLERDVETVQGTSLGRPLRAEAQLGAAKAMLQLERQQDAKRTLQQLAAELPEDPEVVLWLGKAEQSLDSLDAAEQHFRESVRLAPDVFDAYLALAQLFFERERPGDAVAVLTEARERVEDTAEVRRMLGESELARNNLRAAEREFRKALELDSGETAALFGLGVTLRRAGKLEQAEETFSRVAERDHDWPGLSLERGMVFEARGESERAVAMYQQALEDQPDDPDLLLRLGAAQVAAGDADQAEETLQRVIEARPNSAEAEHFMGRVAFARGDLEDSMTHFRRAVSLDGTRGEFFLYLGWAALERGDLGRALEGISKALELDPSLGDAYWIRGRVRVRTGAVQDAREDLERALELKPSRHEAYAALGEAYDQLRRVRDAVRAYETAVEHDPTRGEWWYRLGRLRMDAGNAGAAHEALARATTLGDPIEPQPGWVPDAHRLRGDAAKLTGNRQEAIQHYRKYLELAPPTAIDREDVERSLRRMGEEI